MSNPVTTHSEAETAALGRRLAPSLSAGTVLLLSGDLGAGKTAFVRGLAEGLGIKGDDVNSPTFTLMQSYRGGRLPLLHVDLYRLSDPREIDDLGLEELGQDGVVAIEWAERWHRAPDRAMHVTFAHAGDTDRLVTIYSDR